MKVAPANCEYCGKLVPQSKSSIRNHMVKFHQDARRTKKGPEPKPRKPVDRSEEYRNDKFIRKWRRLLRVQKKAYNDEVRGMNRWAREYMNILRREGLSIAQKRQHEDNRKRMQRIKEQERQDGAKKQLSAWKQAIIGGFGEHESIMNIKPKRGDAHQAPPKVYLGDL